MAGRLRLLGARHGARYMSNLAHIPGGRSSVSGLTVTVIGATGMLGRYVVNKLGRVGTQVVTPYRTNIDETRHLKLMGDLGMIIPMDFHARKLDTIAKIVERSDVVINCLGKQELTMNYNFYGANVEASANIAKVCKDVGVPRFIHVSALAADPYSKSEWLRCKAEGEAKVLEHYPEAAIVRPSIMFGEEDKFLNLIGKWFKIMGVCPLVGSCTNKIAPVYVDDVAEAIRQITFHPSLDAKGPYELAGPENYTLRDVVEFVRTSTDRTEATIRTILPDLTNYMPESMAEYSPHGPGGKVADFFYRAWPQALPGAPAMLGVRGDVNMLFGTDWVETGKNKTFADLGMEGTVNMKEFAPEYLRHYRKGGHFMDSHDGKGTLT